MSSAFKAGPIQFVGDGRKEAVYPPESEAAMMAE
jgi:hypothetical protein